MKAELAVSMVLLLSACGSSPPGEAHDAGPRPDSPATGPEAGHGHDAASKDARGTDARPKDAGGADSRVSDADAGKPAAGPTVGGCPVFPSDYPYNQDISAAPLDPGSATYITNLKSRTGAIDPPTGVSEYVNVVSSTQADVTVQFTGSGAVYGFDTTDKFYTSSGMTGMAPIPSGVLYEDMTTPNSDHHMIVVQQGTCRLFELYSWNPSSATMGWEVMVTWNLMDNDQLPDGWGSTTAAGTPIIAGLIRYDEVTAGEIPHALDIVIPGADLAAYEYVKPAARAAGACGSMYPTDGFPYGGRLRLKSTFDTSGLGPESRVIARALQKYGMINTDDSGYTRSDFRLTPGSWDNTDLSKLVLTWDDFEVPMMAVVSSKACN